MFSKFIGLPLRWIDSKSISTDLVLLVHYRRKKFSGKGTTRMNTIRICSRTYSFYLTFYVWNNSSRNCSGGGGGGSRWALPRWGIRNRNIDTRRHVVLIARLAVDRTRRQIIGELFFNTIRCSRRALSTIFGIMAGDNDARHSKCTLEWVSTRVFPKVEWRRPTRVGTPNNTVRNLSRRTTTRGRAVTCSTYIKYD